MIPRPEQIQGAEDTYNLLKQYGIAYLAWQERTGKSLTAILAAEKSDKVHRVVVLTKKKAIDGWKETINGYKSRLHIDVTNYHNADKLKGKYDLAILDESHSYISSYPTTGVIWDKVYKLVYGLPIIYTSATPYAQGPQLLFHQLRLSAWSPWRQYKNFYSWFKDYAILDKYGDLPTTRINNVQTVVDYKKVHVDKVLADVNHLFLTRMRDFEHEPEDKLHYIQLSDVIKDVYNRLIKERVLQFSVNGKDYLLDCDTKTKLRYALHMLEGGTLKIGDEPVVLNNREKVDYILRVWGDTEDVVIMYNYIGEGVKLAKIFKNAKLLQATSFAEGVDLSGYEHLIIYSQDFSTARHTQRRARQANKERKTEIKVHYLLVEKAASAQVYKTVSVNKTNFVDKLFVEETI